MKKIIFRKLLLDGFIFFLITLLSTSIIIWVFQAVNFLDIMTEDGRDYLVYLKFALLNFPKIISKILPFALFFSFSYVFSKYELSNELMIYWNHGVDKLTLINLFLKFSILIMFFQILLTTFIVPKSQDLARSFLRSSNVDFFDNFIKPKKFNDTIKDLTFYTESKDKEGNLENIYFKKR
jgi:lipopolysaccharide export system permease protein